MEDRAILPLFRAICLIDCAIKSVIRANNAIDCEIIIEDSAIIPRLDPIFIFLAGARLFLHINDGELCYYEIKLEVHR